MLAEPPETLLMPFTATDAVNFLTTNPAISELNFGFRTFKVYPSAYRKDVADAIKKGDVKINL
ncbi:MAG TPA: hypothetical protein VEQ63_00740, partial [Bryobacteraceae bacterium]|nr:hypothetical protein [Bryobacteraceae bacterium]